MFVIFPESGVPEIALDLGRPRSEHAALQGENTTVLLSLLFCRVGKVYLLVDRVSFFAVTTPLLPVYCPKHKQSSLLHKIFLNSISILF